MDSIGSTNGLNVGFWGKMNEEMLESRYPVHRACRDGDHSALSSMIAHGKHDLYSEDQFYGWSPVHWAAYYGKLECLQLLISSGVNGEVATQRFHQSPTHVAAFGSQPHCLMWLLQNGANVNAQDYLGETPAHKAARSGSLECLGILKANGAQFLSQNNNGHVPKDLAISCGNETSARYIMQVQEASAMNGSIHSNGICSRKRGISDLSQEEVKKVRADPSMPFAPPIAPTTEESMGTDGLLGGVPCPRLLEASEEPMDEVSYDSNQNKLGHLPVPEATPTAVGNDVGREPPSRRKIESWKYNLCSDQISNSLTKNGAPNGSASAEFGVRSTRNGSAADVMNGSGDATSQQQHSVQQEPKEYVRVYDYLTNWSTYSGACENNKTLVTHEMETQDAEMADMDDGNESSIATQKCHISNSEVEHKESVIHAQGYDSKLCDEMYEVGYGHAY